MPHLPSSRARTQVLIVGAGPVGLMAAIRLREQGIEVRVIDQQVEHDSRLYPVVLHARTLVELATLGITAPLFWRGRPVTRVAVYTDNERRAVLELRSGLDISPGALTLPQDVLRQALTHSLGSMGVEIEFGCRLLTLEQDADTVRASVIRRGLVAGEAPARTLEWLDVEEVTFEADFVIGSDGYQSPVRTALGIPLLPHGPLESYAFFDAPDRRAGVEAQLALTEDLRSSVYPLQSGMARFSFQIMHALDRMPGLPELKELLRSRMPWHVGAIDSCEWSEVVEFRQTLAARFGIGRVWLAGDAAHSTIPLGVQSLNVGLREASDLGLRIADYLGRPSAELPGARYEAQRQLEWARLLGEGMSASMSAHAPAWVQRNITRLLPCLPASGDDLDDLLDQLRLR